MTKYDRYQDYVIKDGNFIGEFEEMYQDFEDPWDQSFREDFVLSKSVVEKIIQNGAYKRPYELGCGLGYFVEKMRNVSGGVSGGMDISATAIRKAKIRFPLCHFDQGDVLDIGHIKNFKPDCLFMDEITWYVLPKLEKFKMLLVENFSGTMFIHSLRQYPSGGQSYGREYFEDLNGFMDFFSSAIDIKDWGSFGSTRDPCLHTFFAGTVK